MEIYLKLYGSSKMLNDKEILSIELPNNSNIEKLRIALDKMISKKYLKNNLENLSKTAAFFSEADEVVDDNYKLKNKELISIIPPIGGG
jgi:molybdopterin converting factor small subunit|tara:strand:+ start:156 stop:422 length:267 start_codon:yes stop_codon:yes gene_type:complete